jgi:hypothetical protein
MSSLNSQHPISPRTQWRGIMVTLAIELVVLFALSVAVVRYLEWSSDVNQAEFVSPTKNSVSDTNHHSPIQQVKGRPGCRPKV